MALIKIKRGLEANLNNAILDEGELAFTTDSKKLYIGNLDGSKTLVNQTLGSSALLNAGSSSGNVPVLGSDGKLPVGVMPPIVINDTFVVTSQAEMLSLVAQTGDIAIRTDVRKSFVLKGSDSSNFSDWIEMLSPSISSATEIGAEPTISSGNSSQYFNGAKAWVDFATSTRGATLTGLSTASSSTITSADTVLSALGKLQGQSSLKATLISPTFTGTPTAPTASNSTNSTQIATTAFVQNVLTAFEIDGGTF